MSAAIYTLLCFVFAASSVATWPPAVQERAQASSVERSASAYIERADHGMPVGSWGGKRIHMQVGAETTRIEFDCAHAKASRILLDSRGRFAAKATYVEERGGPTRAGDEAGEEVLLKGAISGRTMKLRVIRAGDKEALGSFVLTHGAESELVKCR